MQSTNGLRQRQALPAGQGCGSSAAGTAAALQGSGRFGTSGRPGLADADDSIDEASEVQPCNCSQGMRHMHMKLCRRGSRTHMEIRRCSVQIGSGSDRRCLQDRGVAACLQAL